MDAEPSTTTPAEPSVTVELRALVQRAQAGDPQALPRIRELLETFPQIWEHLGDLSALAERAWIAVLAADHPLAVESMRRTTQEMKQDLAGDSPSRLERMMADQVIVSWMELKYLEGVSADAGPGSLRQAGFQLKRLESAQRRYLSAVKALTTVRALLPAGVVPPRPQGVAAAERQQEAVTAPPPRLYSPGREAG
jgi:hypothetical protein